MDTEFTKAHDLGVPLHIIQACMLTEMPNARRTQWTRKEYFVLDAELSLNVQASADVIVRVYLVPVLTRPLRPAKTQPGHTTALVLRELPPLSLPEHFPL